MKRVTVMWAMRAWIAGWAIVVGVLAVVAR